MICPQIAPYEIFQFQKLRIYRLFWNRLQSCYPQAETFTNPENNGFSGFFRPHFSPKTPFLRNFAPKGADFWKLTERKNGVHRLNHEPHRKKEWNMKSGYTHANEIVSVPLLYDDVRPVPTAIFVYASRTITLQPVLLFSL